MHGWRFTRDSSTPAFAGVDPGGAHPHLTPVDNEGMRHPRARDAPSCREDRRMRLRHDEAA